MNSISNSDSIVPKNIPIENLSYKGTVSDDDFIVKSILLLGYLPGADPVVVLATDDPEKFIVFNGKRRVRGAHLSGKIQSLPCLVVPKTYKSPKSNLDDLVKNLREPRSAYFFIVKILDAVYSGKRLSKNLPLEKEYFTLIQKLTSFKRKSTERTLSVLRDIYKTKTQLCPELSELGIFEFFEKMRLSGEYPELQDFYLDPRPWRLVEDYKKSNFQGHDENIDLNKLTQKSDKQFFNKLFSMAQKHGSNSIEVRQFIADFFANNPTQKTFFHILASKIISCTTVKSGKPKKGKANATSLFDLTE